MCVLRKAKSWSGRFERESAVARLQWRTNPNDNLIPRSIDPKLTDSDRDEQRRVRLAAAKMRQKASRVPKPKKKASKKGQPLRGPNSKRLMKW